MPGGFGLYAPSQGPDAATAAEVHVDAPTPAAGPPLVSSAIAAVGLLAKAAGHPVAIPAASATTPAAARDDVAALIAFVVGLLAIAAAWGVSLSRRPLHIRRRASA
jgi:hypothetical protein